MRFLRVFVLLILCTGSCFAKPVEPEWIKNFRKIYPNTEYIAQKGFGMTAEDAKTDAASQLARYFQSTVSANLSTAMSSITTGTTIEEETKVIDEVNVTSEVDFIGLEFTESFYFKPEKKWYAVAYIVRADAWIQYKPKIEAAKNKFYGFYKKAEEETDSYTRISIYKKAWESSAELMEKLEYGRLISPSEEEKYSGCREAVSEIPSRIEALTKELSVEFIITGDYGNIIESAIKTTIKKCGFTVGTKGNYVAIVNVNSNPSGSDPVTILPAVIVTVKNKNDKAIFSYEANLTEKTVAYTLENAQKKAFPNLADKIIKEINF